ncbi:hypothetical protein MtrunA17_Chr6g0473371 [Medicago truncatula]|uniref:Uncharacterized protein n=1 Tax=Medicago truncatula TaxID=3880 RepID=A0A396HET8_MEDTR|nr:hypothetical protein MtrunA17_Chr6g0473371 [Medicago truncatula]
MELGLSQNGLQRFGGGWHWRAATVALVDGGWKLGFVKLMGFESRDCDFDVKKWVMSAHNFSLHICKLIWGVNWRKMRFSGKTCILPVQKFIRRLASSLARQGE